MMVLKNYFFYSITIFLYFVNTEKPLYAQEIDKEYLKERVQQIEDYKGIKTQQDSLIKLSVQILRLTSDKAIPLFQYLDELVTNDHLKLGYLMEWGTTESRSGNSNYSKFLREKGLLIAKKYQEVNFEFDFCNSLSNHYINIAQVDSATYYSKEAEKLTRLHPEKLGHMLWSVYQRNYNIQGILGNLELQDEFIEKSWNEINKTPNHRNRGYILFLITDHFRKRKNYVKQAEYAGILIEYYNKKKINTPDYHFPIKSVLIKSDNPEAVTELIRVMKTSDSLDNLNALSFTSSTLAQVFLDQKKPEKAIPILERTIFKLDSAKYLVGNSEAHHLLQKAYSQKGDYRNAYAVLTNQKELEDSLRSNALLTKVADYEVKYETQEKERELEKKEANQKLLFWILGLGTFLLVSLLFFFFKNRKQNALLKKQATLLRTTIDEKNVLLRETHHRVKNSFQIVSSLLFLQSKNVKDKEAQLAIKEAQNRVRSMVLIHQRLYNKDQLIGIDTQDYFEDLTKDIFDSHQQQSKGLQYNLNVDPMILGIETITPIGLILNELIVNVLKHGFDEITQKSRLSIALKKEDELLVLKVTDNGKGFEGEIKDTSFGIKLIKALSKKLKATLVFNSSKDNGTEAILNITKFEVL